MNRPTPEQIAHARSVAIERVTKHGTAEGALDAVRVLIAATEPPTDEEIVEFAHAYYEQHDLGAKTIRTHERLLALINSGSSYRVSAMHAAIRHFLGPVKP